MLMTFVDSSGAPVDILFEQDEQELVMAHLPPNSHVLELGARYGTVSCAISSVLNDPEMHVAVEPDPSVQAALLRNRAGNGGRFHVWQGVVSNKPYRLCRGPEPRSPEYDKYREYSTYTEQCDSGALPHMSLQKLQDMFGIEFDAVIADCEGFFYTFVTENIDMLTQFKTIIYEKDGSPWSVMKPKYAELDAILVSKGYEMIDSRPPRDPEHADNVHMHSVWRLTRHN
jgi:FkbM family methyltransferase